MHYEDLFHQMINPERMCREHERPARECLAEVVAKINAEHYRARVREVALLLIRQGCPPRDAVENAQRLEAQVDALVPPEEPGT